MEPIKTTVWITKYALTDGIRKAEGWIGEYGVTVSREGQSWYTDLYMGNDWHRTEADAIARAEEMKAAKLASLEKQIARIKALQFKPQA